MIDENKSFSDLISSGPYNAKNLNLLIAELITNGVLEISDAESHPAPEKPDVSNKSPEPEKPAISVKEPPPADENDGQRQIMLLTDSTADLPAHVIKERDITVIPLTIKINQTEYLDGKDITAREFYQLLKESSDFPATSPPTEAAFHELFTQNIADRDILGLFISRKMSRTFEKAASAKMNNYNVYMRQRAQKSRDGQAFRIELIDSQLVSIGAGLLTIEASDRIRDGWPLDKIRDHIVEFSSKIRVLFIVETLKYLERGARIGKGAAVVGGIFRFKPILTVKNGIVDAKERIRGDKKAQQRVVELIKEDLGGADVPVKIGVCHADAPDKAEQMKTLLESSLNCKDMMLSDFGPTVGSHTGPGTIGIAYYPL